MGKKHKNYWGVFEQLNTSSTAGKENTMEWHQVKSMRCIASTEQASGTMQDCKTISALHTGSQANVTAEEVDAAEHHIQILREKDVMTTLIANSVFFFCRKSYCVHNLLLVTNSKGGISI